MPEVEEGVRRGESLIPLAKDLKRPLLLVHGTADDNVYYRHTLKLADALFRAGKDFEMLPLPGVTHMVLGRPDGDGAALGEDRGVLQDAPGGAEVSHGPRPMPSISGATMSRVELPPPASMVIIPRVCPRPTPAPRPVTETLIHE